MTAVLPILLMCVALILIGAFHARASTLEGVIIIVLAVVALVFTFWRP